MSIPLRTDVEELFDVPEVRVAAERIMPEPYRDFVNNAGMEETLRGDVAAWGELNLRPRALVDVSNVDTSVTVLGQQIALPVITAPFIGSSFIDPEGEIASARGTAHAGSIMTLSMMGSRTPEQIGPESAGRYWQQLYWVRDRDVVEDMVARAVSAGASALCLTVDLPVMPSFPGRMRDAAQALGEHWGAGEHSMYVARDYRDRPFGATFPNPAVSWSDLEWLRGLSDLPLILKGIVRPEDAVRARDHGASAVVVSNHAGQGLRYSMPVAHALPAIVAAVGGDLEVLADSGIRSGFDVLRALALGAKAVLVGRPVLWGLAAGGAAGVERVYSILKDELAEAMAITGAPRIADIDEAVLAPVRMSARNG
ncbi:alpha-hydroxy acid oxidase [Microbacterium sp. E-13]|uniref:alpha-hydroxy acid oxidase n=1 Tax=Microbacterium sp. E-13 TaxID=3404048 RepID=UPI003CFB18FC